MGTLIHLDAQLITVSPLCRVVFEANGKLHVMWTYFIISAAKLSGNNSTDLTDTMHAFVWHTQINDDPLQIIHTKNAPFLHNPFDFSQCLSKKKKKDFFFEYNLRERDIHIEIKL